MDLFTFFASLTTKQFNAAMFSLQHRINGGGWATAVIASSDEYDTHLRIVVEGKATGIKVLINPDTNEVGIANELAIIDQDGTYKRARIQAHTMQDLGRAHDSGDFPPEDAYREYIDAQVQLFFDLLEEIDKMRRRFARSAA